MNAVNSEASLALSPGFSRQSEVEPGRDEEKKHTENNVPKLEGKSA
jgi:hypothetical protein